MQAATIEKVPKNEAVLFEIHPLADAVRIGEPVKMDVLIAQLMPTLVFAPCKEAAPTRNERP